MDTQRPRNAAQTRADILSAARRRFATDGYEPTTLRAIAADVGVDAALVTRYFGSKQDLFATATEFRIELPDLTGAEPGRTLRTCCCRGTSRYGKTTTRSWRCCERRARAGSRRTRLNQTLATHVAPTLRAVTPDNHRATDRHDGCVRHRACHDQIRSRQSTDDRPQSRRSSAWAGPIFRQLLVGPAPS